MVDPSLERKGVKLISQKIEKVLKKLFSIAF